MVDKCARAEAAAAQVQRLETVAPTQNQLRQLQMGSCEALKKREVERFGKNGFNHGFIFLNCKRVSDMKALEGTGSQKHHRHVRDLTGASKIKMQEVSLRKQLEQNAIVCMLQRKAVSDAHRESPHSKYEPE